MPKGINILAVLESQIYGIMAGICISDIKGKLILVRLRTGPLRFGFQICSERLKFGTMIDDFGNFRFCRDEDMGGIR